MKTHTKEITHELLSAMDIYKTIAQQLMDKLISETDQPEKDKIQKGYYYEIQNADLLNGNENLSDNWRFDVHGEHCMFENVITGQVLEVSLRNKESIGDLDPYFFYNFLKSTDKFKHLINYFENPFTDMVLFFEEMERQKKILHVDKVGFRKI